MEFTKMRLYKFNEMLVDGDHLMIIKDFFERKINRDVYLKIHVFLTDFGCREMLIDIYDDEKFRYRVKKTNYLKVSDRCNDGCCGEMTDIRKGHKIRKEFNKLFKIIEQEHVKRLDDINDEDKIIEFIEKYRTLSMDLLEEVIDSMFLNAPKHVIENEMLKTLKAY